MSTVREAAARKSTELARAAAPAAALAEAVANGKVKMLAILQAVGIDPGSPQSQAALLVCDKYDLDPLLKHVVVIPGGKGIYITRDGLLHVAHRSGQLDGMEITETGETDTHLWAICSVWRKDMGRPFTYRGRYPKNGKNKEYQEEMAIKCAEAMALRRAFQVTGIAAKDEAWSTDDEDIPTATEVITATVSPIDYETGEVLPLEAS